MKKVLLVLVGVAVAFPAVFFRGAWILRAPELFGDGRAYVFGAGGYTVGVVDTWGTWLLTGTTTGNETTCKLRQVGGDRIKGVVDGVVPCFMRMKRESRFTGWIDFRGHARPFCGARDSESLPRKCKHLTK
jgi:hypothetical protein